MAGELAMSDVAAWVAYNPGYVALSIEMACRDAFKAGWNASADAAARVDVSKSVEDARALSKSLCDRGQIAMSRTIDELADNLAKVITKNTDQALRIFELEQQLASREAAKP